MPAIRRRDFDASAARALAEQGMHPVAAEIYAARGIRAKEQLAYDLKTLPPAGMLENAAAMASILADAIAARARILVVADYDSDGATACAVALKALRAFGADAGYLVPNRFEYGYGLTPEIVRLAAKNKPDILLTVDNGIASVAGVAEANALGMRVLVTDHHLPGGEFPAAACIVNPNAPASGGAPSRFANLAGVGVVFYVMLALRAELRRRGAFAAAQEPNLGRLLDLVALGTVADVVALDDLNRTLVANGLKRIRGGHACAGIEALFRAAGREPRKASGWDLGFALGPRLNAAGRLEDMALGIECLLCDDPERTLALAQRLDALNRERRAIEGEMHEQAMAALEKITVPDNFSLSLFDGEWHQGVIGILASRLKDKFHRPTIAFARGKDGELKGSGRSIPGLHLRDALDLVSKRHPQLIAKFGGHAMAAGLSIAEEDFARFEAAFEEACRALLPPAMLTRTVETDGSLETAAMSLELAHLLQAEVWGQGFPEPLFVGEFRVGRQRVVGEKHLKLRLEQAGQSFEAMLFFHADPVPENLRAVYRLDANEYNGNITLQLLLSHWEPV